MNWAHWRVTIGARASVLAPTFLSQVQIILSDQISSHFVVLEPNEQAAGGPAWMMLEGMMRTNWTGAAKYPARGPPGCGR